MSTLFELKVPTPERVVQTSDGEGFAVRGLTPLQVFSLYYRHTGELGELFEGIMKNVRESGAAGQVDVESVMLSMLRNAPTVFCEIIVLATGGRTEDEVNFEAALKIAESLPFPVQADAMAKIAELTFTAEMPVGKFLTLVVGLMQQATGALSQVT